jgi:hypothetical protein
LRALLERKAGCAFFKPHAAYSERCQDTEIYSKLKQLHHDFLTKEPADITVELEVTDRLSPEDLCKAIWW